MSRAVSIAVDLVAIVVLSYGIYFRRHCRRDMLFAYLALNAGVLGVTSALDTATVGAGLGLGLFGVLSIIRLRSTELTQAEVAYYFVALAMGLLGGLTLDPTWLGSVLIGVIVAMVWVADHPALLGGFRQQVVTLDRACPDEGELITQLEELLGATVHRVVVERVDLVRDTTTVDVRYRLPARPAEQPEQRDRERIGAR